MRYAIVGGDLRMAQLAAMLRESGRDAAGFFQEKAGIESLTLEKLRDYNGVICNWPPRCPLAEEEIEEENILKNIAPGSTMLLCGPQFPEEFRQDLKYENLWADEKLLLENARLTAEAAIALAMRKSGESSKNLKCCVIGYGRIGTFLTKILKKLGANVCVIARTEEKRCSARAAGASAADFTEAAAALADQEIIFNTVPSIVMDENILKSLKKDALLMDLASPPYGFDLDLAKKLGANACREPGLPGRYCPLGAARALLNAIFRWEEREKYG